MFLVLTRSPRRVEHFSCLSRRILTVRNSGIEERTKKRKKMKRKENFCQNPSVHSCISFGFKFFYFYFNFFLFLLMWDPHVPFLPFSVRFSPKTIYFIPVSILFILIEYSLYICNFSEFFKNPIFRFHSTPAA